MTTTLRPTRPIEHDRSGGKSRRYQVCVNSRPVGAVELATDKRFGSSVGRIVRLEIDEQDRRRGRATVAALAAEEVLRGWGCARVEASIPAGSGDAALGLVSALGYAERGRNMVKSLTEQPELPAGSVARPMNDAEYPAWLAAAQAGYIQDLTARGVSPEQAEAIAVTDHDAALPYGPATPDTALRVLVHEGTDVGTLWVALSAPHQRGGFVFEVEVAAEHRGRGHGRSLMLVAERECLAAGEHTLGLNVFADNAPAVRLYESLGYRVVERHFFKPLLP
ncbi:GNAT family N-acetyltransferase [Streptomyces sp. H27-D2]|uniref:GNAT family N-acetyltransferase n=1 Tax=Streptomyces sp. H27-D2 TaxID=3046304 RepID=UPI002DBA42B7|nr:GNAT family N-acetyltransferase [Streptomyces sp. H27-D2]MEC4020967.1 GNAT family N-acetyltransferase [Streptomyces sp. H27-D2]